MVFHQVSSCRQRFQTIIHIMVQPCHIHLNHPLILLLRRIMKLLCMLEQLNFPEFSTQMTFGGISGVNEATPGACNSTHAIRKIVKCTTKIFMVL